MKQFITPFLLFIGSQLIAQTTADFENFNMQSDTFLNGSEGSGGYASGNVFLPNSYDDIWGSWSGWAISNISDNTSPGFLNQYSAITGSGFEGSENYAVTYVTGKSVIHLENEAVGGVLSGMYVTNGTYPYFSMKDGDSFAKKFGGVSGNDPDFFLLTIKKYFNGQLSADSIDFYLADYRFSNNAEDYIIDEWTYVDLTVLGEADSLQLTLNSSDLGQFGMNTPAYFCVDNIITADGPVGLQAIDAPELFEIYPNPASEYILLNNKTEGEIFCAIYTLTGQSVYKNRIYSDQQQIDLSHLVSGSYILEVQNGKTTSSQLLIKQ